jgi:hypothetical protein
LPPNGHLNSLPPQSLVGLFMAARRAPSTHSEASSSCGSGVIGLLNVRLAPIAGLT